MVVFLSKRGRKPLTQIKPLISDILSTSTSPLTVNQIMLEVQKKMKEEFGYERNVSWNTVKKYLEELVKEGLAFKKEMKPIKATYYWSKPIPW